jgi:hypothetical protein
LRPRGAKAIIAAMTIGATRPQTRRIGQAIYKCGSPAAPRGALRRMSVHDVGDGSLRWPGMVIADEPIIETRRSTAAWIEDAVLITDRGPDPHLGREGDGQCFLAHAEALKNRSGARQLRVGPFPPSH